LSFLGFAVVDVRTHILRALTASTTNLNLQLRMGHRPMEGASVIGRSGGFTGIRLATDYAPTRQARLDWVKFDKALS